MRPAEFLVDSHRSTTLARFTPDLPDGEAAREAVRSALRRTFGWSEAALAALEESLARRISNLGLKNAIAAHLAGLLSGAPGSPALAAQTLRLFERLYGPLPLRPGDVDITLTSTTLILGLPFVGETLLRADFPARPAEERAAIAAFLRAVDKHKSSFRGTLRFPGFGLYDRGLVDRALIAELTAVIGARPGFAGVQEKVVAETLATMVTVEASQEADKFLIHDIWGHGWEESLCDFEWTYARLIELREPVGAASGPRFGGEATPPLREAFAVEDGRVVLDRARCLRTVEADLRGRITIGLNVVVAECLADLVEHKYGRRRAPGNPRLPSSSLFPDAPLKLDLSLKDTQTLLKAAHRSYRRLLAEPAEAARLEAELAAGGVPEAGRGEAVAQALDLLRVELGHVFDTALTPPEARGAGEVRVNLAQRVALGMAALDAALSRFLDDADAGLAPGAPRWRRPQACLDLLVLLLGWFYEQMVAALLAPRRAAADRAAPDPQSLRARARGRPARLRADGAVLVVERRERAARSPGSPP